MDVAIQAITVHTLSKYRVDIACLSEVRLPHFGSREIINRFKGKFCNISVISVYAPTLSADDRDKDNLYAELQLLTKSLPKHFMVIVGGDWDACVGYNAMTSTGKYGIGDHCASGERILRYAKERELFITNTCFRRRRKHLVTWNSPNNQHFNQIDYSQSSLEEFRTK
ncbi:unnamed protein product [Dracunculus medinensis]|uniref:Endo/exonuclease/phosphatase domain-containing protein n=1 Tax=Dracunculus medinensis TaxID=318479 RepID=A0A0N4UPL3_DRAME|nr:unnamed protein product [Dracunculus medinensis]